ncbi:hypothetical protein ASG31_10100 [Chryseobacterium sp. Leaf404]|uniref:lamin tail domain-containing protein n=1 Tax=unclassified Chryseobacterium TaxID=2593645 RepID=UPI0006F2A272|nr:MULTISPECIES: lamin tail domain-containing protein [unclassified Chryseobacterium]KQT16727.1 hypothetical protein ASG31_10100 [Chryseobacterium sp. Leaf404]
MAFYERNSIIKSFFNRQPAAITNDFIELKNIGSTAASPNGATLQYGSPTGGFTSYYSIQSITLAPNQTYLIQQGSNRLGGLINLLNPNLTRNVVLGFDGSTNISVDVGLALKSGKVALASNSIQITGPTASNVLDFVGYGATDEYEGSGAAPSPTILNLISRTSGDTNNNTVDFTATLPTPQPISGTLSVKDVNDLSARNNFIKNNHLKDCEIVFNEVVKDVKIYSLSGKLVRSATVTKRID